MLKRVAAAVLWFYVTASVWNGLAMTAGWPPAAGFVLGALVAVVVLLDPLHVFARRLAAPAKVDRPTGLVVLDPNA